MEDDFSEKLAEIYDRADPQKKKLVGLFIAAMCLNDELEFEAKWQVFTKEISSINRFHIKSTVVKEILHDLKKSPIYIPKNYTLYRARKFKGNVFTETLSKIFVDCTDMQSFLERIAVFLSVETTLDIKNIVETEQWNSLFKAFADCKESGFWGFDKKDSEAPPADKTKAYRANPSGIRYLYTAETVDTALAEIRPSISEDVSIATLRTKRRLKLADIAANVKLSSRFSQVALGDDKDYLPMQYLAETIKLNDFDGIRYASALHKDGINIVLFDPECCEYISSEVHRIGNIIYQSDKKYPFDPEIDTFVTSVSAGDYAPLLTEINSVKDQIKEYFAKDFPA